MTYVFGRNTCVACKEKVKLLEASGKEFKYYDLETAEGLAKAAAYCLLTDNRDLPIVLEIVEPKK